MCNLGESWPSEYRGKLFIGNIHGQRVNMDIPERSGSGFVGRHGKDFLNFNDTWSQTLNQTYDQDGSVYIIDWYDKNQCHHTRVDGHDRSNGRIYKIVYNNQKTSRVDLAKLSDEQLVKLVPSKNEFMSRHARQILQERAAGKPAVKDALVAMLKAGADTAARLRALWALHVTVGFDAATAINNLKSSDEWVRGWTLQLAFESEDNLQRLIKEKDEQGLTADPDLLTLADRDPSPLVRLFIAGVAQRISNEDLHQKVVKRLLQHDEDAGDHNLPLMYWYAMEPLVAEHPEEALTAALETKLPKLLNFTTRRIASIGTIERSLVSERLGTVTDEARQLEMLDGLSAALKGQRSVPMPSGWETVETKLSSSPYREVRTLAQTLSLTFGSEKARTTLREVVADKSAPVPSRLSALESLLGVKDPELPPVLLASLNDAALRGPSLRALGSYNEAKIPDAILNIYPNLDGAQKRDALNTLASRPAYAKALLGAISSGKLPMKELTADLVRQLRTQKDSDVQEQITKLYGTAREVSADKKAEMEKYRRIYSAGGSQPGNASPGRVVFNKVCAQCHTLFDSGGKVGPDITGANRSDLNYLLENILDPHAGIPNE